MYSKVFLLLVCVAYVYGQVGYANLPVLTKRAGVLPNYATIPSGPIKKFLSYPNVRRGSIEDSLAIAGPYLRSAPILAAAPAPAVLNRVATYGLTNGITGGIALGAKAQVLGPVLAAIITHRTADVIDVPTPEDVITPQVLVVEPNLLPVTIEFRSQSSPVNIRSLHIPGPPGEVKSTRSEEEPDRVLHEVVKPVIQEVREIIQPFRKITQEILPVQEEVHSLVARGDNKKVLQELTVPDPVPVQFDAVAQPIAAPINVAPAVAVAQPVIRAEVIEPVHSFHDRTIVRAGLIGGARVLEADPNEPVPSETKGPSVDRRSAEGQDLSVNNRGPARLHSSRRAA